MTQAYVKSLNETKASSTFLYNNIHTTYSRPGKIFICFSQGANPHTVQHLAIQWHTFVFPFLQTMTWVSTFFGRVSKSFQILRSHIFKLAINTCNKRGEKLSWESLVEQTVKRKIWQRAKKGVLSIEFYDEVMHLMIIFQY